MSEGGTKKAQLEKITQDIKEEEKLWMEAKLPPPGNVYVFGTEQFQYACKIEALTVLVRDYCGVSEEDMELEFKKIVLNELRNLRTIATQVRSQMVREELTKGIVMQPPKMPGNGGI